MKTCPQCQSPFEVHPEDRVFYDKISPVIGGKKYSIPEPTLCPDCRAVRRQLWFNQNHLYHRKSDLSGKDILSIYSPDKKVKVYSREEWWSDKWDATDYGREFDFSRPFFEQFAELLAEVPMMALYVDRNENSDYANYCLMAKNCYLCFCADYNEDCLYYQQGYYSKDTVDSLYSYKMELCYECTDCKDSYRLFHSRNSSNCQDSWYLLDCSNCRNCFGSVGLRSKQYCFFNEQLSKQDYESCLNGFLELGYAGRKEMEKRVQKHFLQYPQRATVGLNNEMVTGDYLFNSKNTRYSFDSIDLEDSAYCFNIKGGKDFFDVSHWGVNSELIYECAGVGENSQRMLFSSLSWNGCSDLIYCMSCTNSVRDCFGCFGLTQKQYCILNKQYTKDEYEVLVPKIIEHMRSTGEWGEFFPKEIAMFGYNESQVQDYYPLTREEALAKSYKWSDYEAPAPKVEKIIPAPKLPDKLVDTPDDILSWAIECEVTGRPFRLIAKELAFYRQNKLPIPRRCPDQRHTDRMALRNPRKLWGRECSRCGMAVQTSYAPEKLEKIYCEACYLQEVY